jgi:D-amino peptidase
MQSRRDEAEAAAKIRLGEAEMAANLLLEVAAEEARKLIREGAKRAMGKIGIIKPFAINPPIKAEITYTDPTFADNLEHLPFIERIDGRTVTYTAPNFIDAFEIFNMLQFYGGNVR